MLSIFKINRATGNIDIIRVACNLPLSGVISIYGESVRNGYTLALEDYNDKFEQNNIKVSIDYEDNRGEQKYTTSIFHHQQINGFDVYVSGVTQQTLAIKEMVDKCNCPHIIWSFYPLVLSQGQNLFRTWVDHEPTLFLKYLKSRNDFKRVACVYLNAPSGQELFNKYFIPMVKDENKYEIVYNEAFDINQPDFKSVVAKIKETKPDIIFVNGFESHIIELAKEFTQVGLKKDGNVVFTFDLLDAMGKVDNSVLEGYVSVIPNCIASPSKKLVKWSEMFKSRFGREPNYTDIYAYDGFCLLAEAILLKKEGLSLIDALHSVQIEGLTGELAVDKAGKMNTNSGVYIFKSGKFVSVFEEE
jgi:branched-chain amino acid transport system substrate-binding protein